VADANSNEPGYFVPEAVWSEMTQTVDAIGAITDVADGPERDVRLSNRRLMALMEMVRGRFVAVRDSARFVA
jgi:hypothetical protein